MEFPYYYDELKKRQGVALTSSVGEHCSAFVATGRYTKDGRIVIGHNNWTDYLTGTRWKVIFDIAPSTGHRFIMDGVPGLIHSADDFAINDAGMISITETTRFPIFTDSMKTVFQNLCGRGKRYSIQNRLTISRGLWKTETTAAMRMPGWWGIGKITRLRVWNWV